MANVIPVEFSIRILLHVRYAVFIIRGGVAVVVADNQEISILSGHEI